MSSHIILTLCALTVVNSFPLAGAETTDKLSFTKGLPIQVNRIAPVIFMETAPGHYFADFGQTSFAGLELDLPGATSGQKLTVALGEALSGPQTIDHYPAPCIRFHNSELTLNSGQEIYRVALAPADKRRTTDATGPVMPFRYAEIDGAPSGMRKDQIYQLAAHYPFDNDAALFHCSDPQLDAIWDLCHHTMKATSYAGIFVDGDRERKPYEADAYINLLGWYSCSTDSTLPRKTLAYLMVHHTWPTEWIMFSVLSAWEDYRYTGDTTFLEKFYPDLRACALQSLERDDGLISTVTPPVSRDVETQFHLKVMKDIVDWPEGERDDYDMKPINTVVNAFHCLALKRMAQIADVLHHPADAELFSTAATKSIQSLNQKLIDPSTGLFVDGEGSTHSSLHANMFPLAFGLVAPEREKAIADYVGQRPMACSVYGAQFLLEALFDNGHADHAIELMTADNDRSWTHMLNVGATLTWEAWDQKYKPNLDWNHAWGAAPANVIPRNLMGISPLEPGFSKVLIQPHLGSLAWAEMRVPTMKGSLYVRVQNNPSYRVDLALPPGMSGRLDLDSFRIKAQTKIGARLVLDGIPTTGSPNAEGMISLDNLAAGKHSVLLQ